MTNGMNFLPNAKLLVSSEVVHFVTTPNGRSIVRRNDAQEQRSEIMCSKCNGTCDGEVVLCQWVSAVVKKCDLIPMCDEFIKDSICNHCPRSEQLDLGMKPKELLRNLKGE
jgi:RecJ-like exonuclease